MVVDIRASVTASLDGRRAQAFTDPQVNLGAEPPNLLPSKWIMPLTEPLPLPDANKANHEQSPSPLTGGTVDPELREWYCDHVLKWIFC